MRIKWIVWSEIVILLTACSQSNFAGKSNHGAQSQQGHDDSANPESPVEEKNELPAADLGHSNTATEGDDDDVNSDDSTSVPSGLVEQESVLVVQINYDACKALPASGKRGYGKCNSEEVTVIVNDGKAQEMTCCPIGGKNILSSKASDLFVERTGTCQSGEVQTGMIDAKSSRLYCSRINETYLKLSSAVPAIYVKGALLGIMGEIAASYNNSDTCICPEGTASVGGHTASDNRCAEQCVKIIKK